MSRGRRRLAALAAVAAGSVLASCAARGAPQTTVVFDAGATIPPRVVRQGAVEIPPELRDRPCTSGTSVVEVEVGATGRVQSARVSRASGEPAFDEACLQSVHRAVYEPATSHGRPVVGLTRVECRLSCP